MTRSPNKVGTTSPTSENTPRPEVATLIAAIVSELADVFALMGWAEDEIERASRRHPDQADTLYHAFSLLRPGDLAAGMGVEFVYRSHVRELLERVATGADTRRPSAAELCLGCARVSLRVPLHGAAAGLYLRMWLRAFPDRPITSAQAAEQVHYERLHGAQIDEYEAQLRRAATDPDRRLADIVCVGRHHGRKVTCRYAPLA